MAVRNDLSLKPGAWHFHGEVFYLHLFTIRVAFRDDFILATPLTAHGHERRGTGLKRQRRTTVPRKAGPGAIWGETVTRYVFSGVWWSDSGGGRGGTVGFRARGTARSRWRMAVSQPHALEPPAWPTEMYSLHVMHIRAQKGGLEKDF